MEQFIEKEFETCDMVKELNKMSNQGYYFVMVVNQTKDGAGYFDPDW